MVRQRGMEQKMSNTIDNVDFIRCIASGEPFICMFSGGKDCGLALSMALQNGTPAALLHFMNDQNEESMFHKQKTNIIEAQSMALNIPVIFQKYKWWVRWDKISKLYMDFRKQGVKYVVFGDLHIGKASRFQIQLCKSAGLIPCFPLYFLSYDILITEIEKRKIESIITIIDHPSIESKWLGKYFDRKAYDYFSKIDIDPFGEHGEYHTTLINADCFNRLIKYEIMSTDKRKIDVGYDKNGGFHTTIVDGYNIMRVDEIKINIDMRLE